MCCEQQRKNTVIGLEWLKRSVRLSKQHNVLKDRLTAVCAHMCGRCTCEHMLHVYTWMLYVIHCATSSADTGLSWTCAVAHLSWYTTALTIGSRPFQTSSLLFQCHSLRLKMSSPTQTRLSSVKQNYRWQVPLNQESSYYLWNNPTKWRNVITVARHISTRFLKVITVSRCICTCLESLSGMTEI